jgi:hypothetical protein
MVSGTMACPDCGYGPCACEEILEAHYDLCPEDEPMACIMCGNVHTALLLDEGLCERCHPATYEDGY